MQTAPFQESDRVMVEEGLYRAQVDRIEEGPEFTRNGKTDKTLKWHFTILNDSQYEGEDVTGLTPISPTRKNKLTAWLGVLGYNTDAFIEGQGVDLGAAIGRYCWVDMRLDKSGDYTNVKEIRPMREQDIAQLQAGMTQAAAAPQQAPPQQAQPTPAQGQPVPQTQMPAQAPQGQPQMNPQMPAQTAPQPVPQQSAPAQTHAQPAPENRPVPQGQPPVQGQPPAQTQDPDVPFAGPGEQTGADGHDW